jgi:hypothetical protein
MPKDGDRLIVMRGAVELNTETAMEILASM